jgi:TonB-dependent starch-binding outer membrane protein SusC
MKKKHFWENYFQIPPFSKKLLLTMKLTILLTCFLSVSIHASTYSQNTRMKLDIKNQSIRDVLHAIENQSNFRFFYNDEFTDLNKVVSCNFENKTIEEILSAVFSKSEVTYKVLENNFVVITPFGLQQLKITGTITDASTNEPLPGVNIVVEGTTTGAISDINGKYSIDIPNADAILVFSFVGYLPEKMPVKGQSNIDVVLSPDVKALDEVIVIGYGVQKKGDVTSAISSVKSEDFSKGMIRDASDLIKGKIAGLSISNGSGDPSSQANIMLRGISTLTGNAAPLVLINGIQGGLNTVAPEDIELVDVLKDASAAAIYGTRGANGVILITTKSGQRNMKPVVTVNSYVSASNFGKKADFMDAADIRSKLAAGTKIPFTDEGTTTNWLDEITRTAISQNHSLSIMGGRENSNYSANISYNDKNGVFKRTNDNELKASFDLNQFFFKDIVKINFNFVKGLNKTNCVGEASSFNRNIYRQALIRNPTAPIKDANGNWVETSRFQYYNPLAMIYETSGLIKSEWTWLTSNLTIRPFAGLEANAMVATRNSNSLTGYSESKKHYSNTMNGKNGVASRNTSSDRSDNLELTAKYNKSIGLHKFTALAGYSYEYTVDEGFYAYNYNFPSDNYSYNNLEAGYALKDGKADMSSWKSDSKLIGFFGRVTYGYGDRYNFLASIRREGSSKFGTNYKWGIFPSVSAGWTISNESFMKGITFINNMKLRVGYGITGVIPSASYASQTLLKYDPYFYSNGSWVKGLVPVSNPNPDLRWEKSAELNIGLDFALLGNRITGSIDVYNKKTTDMLWSYDVPAPPYLYNKILANVGEMSNKGIEIALSGTPVKTKDFDWKSDFTLSHNQNELVSLSNDLYSIENNFVNEGDCGDPISFPTHRLEVGKPMGNFWGLKSVDISDKGKWIIETPTGERKELDKTMYNDANKQYLGNGIPKVIAGWSNTFRYKNVDLSLVFTGAFGFKILNFQRMFYENPTINYNMLKSAFDKVYGKSLLNYDQTYVSYYIEDGDYVKLDNVTLGYTFNVKKVNFLRSLRVYASGQNLLCFTKYKGLDPEIARSDIQSEGDDSRDKYPSIRTFTFGINVSF